MVKQPRQVKWHAPFYAQQADQNGQSSAIVHRYLDVQFMSHFANDVHNGQMESRDTSWIEQDRFSESAETWLRLPIHRCFYVLSCEVSCEQFGQPAFDPENIISAGFVIRRNGKEGTQCWLLDKGVAQGWTQPLKLWDEPDSYRYLSMNKLVESRIPPPPYTGEQTYPLSPIQVTRQVTRQTDGSALKKHTILYGYLPLGGSFQQPLQEDTDSQLIDDKTLIKELHWPFGERNISSFTRATGIQVRRGRPTTIAFVELLDVLLNRYQITNRKITENEAIRSLLGKIRLDSGNSRSPSLVRYLDRKFKALLQWQQAFKKNFSTRLPNYGSDRSKSHLSRDWDIAFNKQQAELLRNLLVFRLQHTIGQTVIDLPISRYQQGEYDRYFAQVFLRYKDEKGCEKISWGSKSMDFRVAAPFDPEASRTHMVQMPELKDLKRGFAQGVGFITPKSLADKIEAMKMDLDDMGEKQPGNSLGTSWIYSFSLPAITLCAMILLTIMISLLNIIFYWLPWVKVRIPIPGSK